MASKEVSETLGSNTKKRKGRGSTMLPELIRNRSSGIRHVVEYNELGQTVGKVATQLKSYFGVLGRKHVPITYDNWHKVPVELKNDLWSCVLMQYIVQLQSKNNVLSSIGVKWRSFKNRLTKIYILPFKDDPEALKKPPAIYNFIEQQHWEEFVKDRLSDKFQEISQKQKERRAKNIYNHRLSRKGYAGLNEECKRTLGTTADIDRSVLWKKARQNKKGEFEDEVVRVCAAKIDEYTKQSEDGVISIDGSNDVLTMALGTSEHPGRVRGVGHSVCAKTYFHTPKKKSLWEEQKKSMELQIERLQEELRSMKEQAPHNTTPLSERGSTNRPRGNINCPTVEVQPRNKEQVIKPNNELRTGIPCALAVDSKKDIVARGTVIEVLGPNSTIHTVALSDSNFVRVSIDYVANRSALLPIPVGDEFITVEDAIGSVVVWPIDLVLTVEEELSLKNPLAQERLSQNNPLAQEQSSQKNPLTQERPS